MEIVVGLIMAALFVAITVATSSERAESAFWKRNGWEKKKSGHWRPKGGIKWNWWDED